MNENITCVVVNGRNIEVKNGCVLVFTGHGPYDAAFYKKLEDCSNADFDAAKEVDTEFTPKPWGDSLDDDIVDEPENNVAAPEYKYSFDKAVDFLAHCKGEDFLELVRYARAHGNRFFNCVKEITNISNANVAYYTAIVRLTRPLGEAVEHKAFELFEAAMEDENAVEDFLDMWKSLQTISYFCS